MNIHGYGDNLTVNNIRIGNLSPAQHEKIEKDKGGRNYRPLENVVVSHVKDSSTLICRKPTENGVASYIEEELIDGLCCYSAVNQGQLNTTIVEAETTKEGDLTMYELTIKNVQEEVFPEMNEEFIKKVDSEATGETSFRENVIKKLPTALTMLLLL